MWSRMLVRKECINMEEKIVKIINSMADYLNIEQLKNFKRLFCRNYRKMNLKEKIFQMMSILPDS